jgi:hypothetical protein
MIIQAVCQSFKNELLGGIHDLDTDTLKIALYTSSAVLDATTTAYSATNEVTGTGYTAGGKTITAVTITNQTDTNYTTTLDFDDIAWTASTFTARGALVYNSSKANRAVFVLDFGGDKTVSSQTLTVRLPANAFDTAILRIK